eukprot:6202765-Pleurochrysis_carterae.AAC.1
MAVARATAGRRWRIGSLSPLTFDAFWTHFFDETFLVHFASMGSIFKTETMLAFDDAGDGDDGSSSNSGGGGYGGGGGGGGGRVTAGTVSQVKGDGASEPTPSVSTIHALRRSLLLGAWERQRDSIDSLKALFDTELLRQSTRAHSCGWCTDATSRDAAAAWAQRRNEAGGREDYGAKANSGGSSSRGPNEGARKGTDWSTGGAPRLRSPDLNALAPQPLSTQTLESSRSLLLSSPQSSLPLS